jgi:glycosyltransferase involved in cell wall biosynthesis
MGALRLLEAYRLADAFCLPSCQEPLGLVLQWYLRS